MNMHKVLYVLLLATSLLMTGCTTPRYPDGTIDVCKLTKLPKEAKKYETHAADLLEYPEKISDNYSGCQAVWLAGVEKVEKSHLLLMIKFDGGSIRRVDWFEPHEDKVMCEFDKNKSLFNGVPDKCLPYERWLRE